MQEAAYRLISNTIPSLKTPPPVVVPYRFPAGSKTNPPQGSVPSVPLPKLCRMRVLHPLPPDKGTLQTLCRGRACRHFA